MRVRKEDADGDMIFGVDNAFFVDQPEAVAQIVLSRMYLFKGEWFLDTSDGTDWAGSVLGKHTKMTRDMTIQFRIARTQKVKEIKRYTSVVDPDRRELRVEAILTTVYGTTTAVFGLGIA